jgi:hypothetical protein
LLLDDWLFEEYLPVQEKPSTVQAVFSEKAFIHIAPDTSMFTIAYAYQQLEQQWRQYLHTLAELPHLTERAPLEKTTSTLLYTAAQDRFLGANDGVRKVVSLCKRPIQGTKLLGAFAEPQKAAVKKILTRLVQDGFLKIVPSEP